MQENQVLRHFQQTGALLDGHFELRSGLHSDRFFQCAHLLRHPRRAEALAADLAHRLRQTLPDLPQVTGVISPAMGGIIVGHELARALDTQSIFAEKQDGRLCLRRFQIAPGQTWIVAEDVVTRGGRVQETIDIVRAAGAAVAAVALLVDRSDGRLAFDCPVISLLRMTPRLWPPADCPLCRSGRPLSHPGS